MAKRLTVGLVKKHSGNFIGLEIITKGHKIDGKPVGFMLRIGKAYIQLLREKP